MPRAPRIDIPGLVYHVTSRGNRQSDLFHDEEDRGRFLRFLSQARDEFPFQLHAYCLMTNHYHLLLQTIEDSLANTMQYFKSHYAIWFNRKYKHTGHLHQGRYHSIPVETDAYFTTVARYIHLNPVRAGMVARPEDYRWSNYERLIHGKADPLVDSRFLLDYFGRDVAIQRQKYRLFVEDGMKRREPITERVLQRMRFWGKPPDGFEPLKPLSQQVP
jgi:putative transposase